MAFSRSSKKLSPGVREAMRFLKAPRREPTDADRPPPSMFAGKEPYHISGPAQLRPYGG
jgi:hypothetical protein